MKTDKYTKTVLTVIAICLTVNVVKDFEIFPSAYANSSENIAETPANTVMDVRLVDINTNDELNVNLKQIDAYEALKVNISKIDTSDELDVNIDEIGGGWVTNGGPIPVKVQ